MPFVQVRKYPDPRPPWLPPPFPPKKPSTPHKWPAQVEPFPTLIIPLSFFAFSLPASSPTLRIIEALPRTSPIKLTAEESDPLRRYRPVLFVDAAFNRLCLRTSHNAARLAWWYLFRYLQLLGSLRPIHHAEYTEIPELPAYQQGWIMELADSKSNYTDGEDMQVLTHLEILATKLGLEGLRKIALCGLAKSLGTAANLVSGWNWEDGVNYTDEVNRGVDVRSIVELVLSVYANVPSSAELARGREAAGDEENAHVKLYNAARDNCVVGVAEEWSMPALFVGELWELVLGNFWAGRVQYLRGQREIEALLGQYPRLRLGIRAVLPTPTAGVEVEKVDGLPGSGECHHPLFSQGAYGMTRVRLGKGCLRLAAVIEKVYGCEICHIGFPNREVAIEAANALHKMRLCEKCSDKDMELGDRLSTDGDWEHSYLGLGYLAQREYRVDDPYYDSEYAWDWEDDVGSWEVEWQEVGAGEEWNEALQVEDPLAEGSMRVSLCDAKWISVQGLTVRTKDSLTLIPKDVFERDIKKH
ncbi:hypothetical protein BJ508DRAFT_344312 [Ascobolus immersus RN42]|uniref:Uncharacterized protein n=1 Tax=Ascobolus immersus RN42 TaxID=1160509 RepID=A0A3N4I8T2_ASCIM|nr:hypothetical protein BJ508DRAFT_344312 [Ascobolus immersus RN42]